MFTDSHLLQISSHRHWLDQQCPCVLSPTCSTSPFSLAPSPPTLQTHFPSCARPFYNSTSVSMPAPLSGQTLHYFQLLFLETTHASWALNEQSARSNLARGKQFHSENFPTSAQWSISRSATGYRLEMFI